MLAAAADNSPEVVRLAAPVADDLDRMTSLSRSGESVAPVAPVVAAVRRFSHISLFTGNSGGYYMVKLGLKANQEIIWLWF